MNYRNRIQLPNYPVLPYRVDSSKLQDPFYQLSVMHPSLELKKILTSENINSPNNYGDTLLHYACKSIQTLNYLKILIESGADLNATNREGKTPLHILVKTTIRSSFFKEEAVLLVNNGADIYAKDEHGITPLDICKGTDLEKLLLEADNFGSATKSVT